MNDLPHGRFTSHKYTTREVGYSVNIVLRVPGMHFLVCLDVIINLWDGREKEKTKQAAAAAQTVQH